MSARPRNHAFRSIPQIMNMSHKCYNCKYFNELDALLQLKYCICAPDIVNIIYIKHSNLVSRDLSKKLISDSTKKNQREKILVPIIFQKCFFQ